MLTDFTKADNPISYVNPAFTALTGYSALDAVGRNCRFLQGAATDPNVVAEIREALAAGRSIHREVLNYHKNGDAIWIDLTIDPIRDEAGLLTGFIGIQSQTIAAEKARGKQVEAERRLQGIIGNLPGFIFRRTLTPDGAVEGAYFGALVTKILGIADGEPTAPGQFYNRVHPDDRERLRRGVETSAADLTLMQEEFRLLSTEGAVHWIRSLATPRKTPNGDIVWDGLALEITAEKAADTQLSFLAFHDSLTGLSNRVRFKNSLRAAIDMSASDGQRIVVFFLDLDAFQDINNTLGQSAGDTVLRSLGQRLKDLAETAGGTVARLGGDEFAVMLPSIPIELPVAALAESIRATLMQTLHIDGQDLAVQACIGIALFPHPREEGQTPAADACDEIMQQADIALHAAKREGPGNHRVYAAELDDRSRNRMALRQSMQRAIAEEQFELHYQPLVELASGRIVSVEALVRWNHPDLGMQRPDLFISLAEASGLIVPLGAWIMKRAMRQGHDWRLRGLKTPPIAINVSSIQLQKPGFIAAVEQALAETGANPRDYEFELTESVLIEASSEILAILNGLKKLGFSIAIDDFGTGHSTFKYLRDFPVDKIKIDQTFIRKLVIDSSDASIVRAMIALSRSLGVEIVAEGIETTMQRDFLRDEGCKVGQGYLFSMPLTAEDFGWVLERGMTLPMAAHYSASQ